MPTIEIIAGKSAMILLLVVLSLQGTVLRARPLPPSLEPDADLPMAIPDVAAEHAMSMVICLVEPSPRRGGAAGPMIDGSLAGGRIVVAGRVSGAWAGECGAERQ